MPRRKGSRKCRSPVDEPQPPSVACISASRLRGRKHRHFPSGISGEGIEEVSCDALGCTYDTHVDCGETVVGSRDSALVATSSERSEVEATESPFRNRCQRISSQTFESSPCTIRPPRIVSPRKNRILLAAPLQQRRLSRSSLFSSPPRCAETTALPRTSSPNRISPAEPYTPINYCSHWYQPSSRSDRSPWNAPTLSRTAELTPRNSAPPCPFPPPAGVPLLHIPPLIARPPRSSSPLSQPLSSSPPVPPTLAQRQHISRPTVGIAKTDGGSGRDGSAYSSPIFPGLPYPSRSTISAIEPPLHPSAFVVHRPEHASSPVSAPYITAAVTAPPVIEHHSANMGHSYSYFTRKVSANETDVREGSREEFEHRGENAAPRNSKNAKDATRLASRRKASSKTDINAIVGTFGTVTTPSDAAAVTQRPDVDEAHWVYQRPPNNQRTFYFAEDNLEFSSQFDSGNLIQVERIGAFTYRMFTAMDCGNAPWQTNNRQWFHFSVRGGSKGATLNITFIAMMHSSMFTYDWMPVVATVPTKPQYTRLSGKSIVEALEVMPETPGYPLLVHKSVSRDDADSDGGGDEDDNDGDATNGNPSSHNNGNGGGVAFAISPTDKAGGGAKRAKRKKKKCIAMNLSFSVRIESELPITHNPPQGRPDVPAMYVASNHPYSYATLQRNLLAWGEAAQNSCGTLTAGAQILDHRAQQEVPASPCSGTPSTVIPGGRNRGKKGINALGSSNVPGESSPTNGSMYFHSEVLCKSLEGRSVTLLTISDYTGITTERAPLFSKEDGIPYSSAHGVTKRPFCFSGKQFVVLTARVHPGECPGSHIMHGCIDFLLNSTDSRAAALRQKFVFCVVPMLNPDGVVRGHSRVDSNGIDLNRMYRDPSRKQHPAPYAMLALLRSLGKDVALFVDMHAHANRKGTFFYGNSMDGNSQVENLLYAKLVSLNTPYLDFRSCNFSEANMFAVGKSGKGKDSSSRVVVFMETGILYSYTIETSHVMADALNPVVPLTSQQGDATEGPLPSPPSVMHTPVTFADTGRAILLGLLDLKGLNPMSRLPFTQYHSARGLAMWLQRQIQIESAELLFVQAFKARGKEIQNSTHESGNALLATIMKSMPIEEYPEKITIKKARLLPRITFSGAREFIPVETAISVLSQTVPTVPPRSLLYSSSSSTGGVSMKRRGPSPPLRSNNGTDDAPLTPPAVIATRRRSKSGVTSGGTVA